MSLRVPRWQLACCRQSILAVVILVAGAVGCREATEPPSVPDVGSTLYTLVEIAGAPVPAMVAAPAERPFRMGLGVSPVMCTLLKLWSGAVTLRLDGTFTHVISSSCISPLNPYAPSFSETLQENGSFTIDGSVIHFSFALRPGQTGTRNAASLTLTGTTWGTEKYVLSR